jgi:probable O-glycosylation ligase (exosortase A-associated)
MKIWFMTFALIFLINTHRHLELVVWAIVLSIGYYSVKGGLFTLLKGGQHIVWGPAASVIANSNHLAVAIVMCIPLAAYLYEQAEKRWVRWALIGGILLSSICVLGSYSRGALLAVAAMGLLLWLRSRRKAPFLIIAALMATVVVPFMPSQWEARMGTMKTYEEESSAMARLNAWEAAYNAAKDRFPIGAGFEYQSPQFSAKYAPDPTLVHVAHSLYFQTLGSQGFAGLGLLLAFWFLVWRNCSAIRKQTAYAPELAWARSLASMVQVSLVGYFVGGAFIDTAFWDLPFYLFAIVAITSYVVAESLGTAPAEPGRASAENHLSPA